jgi:hypothetical protein
MEGKFYRIKTSNHPHTNMAKAALNMMTRTSAADYVRDGIYMNSVDTGLCSAFTYAATLFLFCFCFCFFNLLGGVRAPPPTHTHTAAPWERGCAWHSPTRVLAWQYS